MGATINCQLCGYQVGAEQREAKLRHESWIHKVDQKFLKDGGWHMVSFCSAGWP